MAFYRDLEGTLRVREFERWPWLAHGFSTRRSGNLAQPEDRARFTAAVGEGKLRLVTLRQIHSDIVQVAGNGIAEGEPGDSLIATEPGLLVGVKTADCLPVLIVDPKRRAVAAAHAGWRGVVQRIAEKTVGEMRRAFGCDPADLWAAIGPGIQACCFEVGPEVLQQFAARFVDAEEFCRADPPNPADTMIPRQVMTDHHALMRQLNSDRGRVDLAEACRRQLLAAGVPAQQIVNAGLCTACDLEQFFSYRREKDAAGRMLAVIGVRAAS